MPADLASARALAEATAAVADTEELQAARKLEASANFVLELIDLELGALALGLNEQSLPIHAALEQALNERRALIQRLYAVRRDRRLLIPSIHVDVDLAPWGFHPSGKGGEGPSSSAFWHAWNSRPGDRGYCIITAHRHRYGLDYQGIFGGLADLRHGREAYVRRQDGELLVFEIDQVGTILPDGCGYGDIVHAHAGNLGVARLALYTCEGPELTDGRRVCYAHLVEKWPSDFADSRLLLGGERADLLDRMDSHELTAAEAGAAYAARRCERIDHWKQARGDGSAITQRQEEPATCTR